MKPNFALSLSFDGIALYHRAASGWLTVGTASLEDPDLEERLRVLRRTAAELEPRGISTKLLIPNSEVLYREIDAPGPGDHSRALQVRQGLEGLTPYAVEELAWDYRPIGDKAHVAVVARETLTEAEAFATQHRFNPLCYVAVPDPTWFSGEPFFGETTHAKTFLGRRDKLERDDSAVRPSGKIMPPAGAGDDKPVVETSDVDPVVTSPLRTTKPAAVDPVTPPVKAEAPEASKPEPVAAPAAPKPEPAKAKAEAKPAKTKSAGRAASGHSLFDPKPAKPVTRPGSDDGLEPDMGKGIPAPTTSAPALAASAKAPPVAPAFSSRRSGDGAIDARPAESTLAKLPPRIGIPAETGAAPPPRAAAPYTNGAAAGTLSEDPEQQGRLDALGSKFGLSVPKAEAFRAGVAPMLERTRALGRRLGERKAKTEAPVNKEAEALTIFSQRGQTQNRGSAKTGLMLTLILVAVMVLVALGSLFMTDNGTGTAPPEDIASAQDDPAPITDAAGRPDTAAVEAIEPEDVLPDASTEEELAAIVPPSDIQVDAPVEEEIAAPEPEPEPTPAPEVRPAPQPLTEEMAEARYAATGIWQLAPDPIAPPARPDSTLDDLYVASIDPVVTSEDAFALNEVPSRAGDVAPSSSLAPAPFGTTFDFDERGLVTPTPDGALSPDGIPVFSGAPSVVPGPRPQGLAPEQDSNAGPTTGAPATPEIPAIRPPLRPEGLIEGNERARLGGRTLTELAAVRPTLRPETLQTASLETEIEDLPPPTENAVAASILPRQRPGNFEQVVSAAQQARAASLAAGLVAPSAGNTPEPQVTSTSPDPVENVAAARAPSQPVAGDVARTATVENAINLGRLNLIGVYGAPSDRRALIRLTSGRYVKVKVGDSLDGGQIAAIGESELRYIKNGRNLTLALPRG